jgi:uncharacterized protein (UPF0262 family)
VSDRQRLVNVFLDERSVVRRSATVEHERRVAIFDLLEENRFSLVGAQEGPYVLRLSIEENRLAFDVRDEAETPIVRFTLSLGNFRKVVRDYFLICDSYYTAIRTASPSRIEAIDMGRRGLHDEGSRLLQERLAEKVEVDMDTARRLFTLMCVLQIR